MLTRYNGKLRVAAFPDEEQGKQQGSDDEWDDDGSRIPREGHSTPVEHTLRINLR